MQLDQSRIAIRERSYLDILDLALPVIRQHFAAFVVCSVVGAAPFLLLNMAIFSALGLEKIYDDEDAAYLSGYAVATMFVLYVELPLAAMPLTAFLGKSLFEERPRWQAVAADCLTSLPQMTILQVLGRVPMMPLWITLVLPYVRWPYLSEVILLERNPLFGGRRKAMTSVGRSKKLHRDRGGDLFGRWLASASIGALLTLGVWMALEIGLELAIGTAETTLWTDVLVAQLAVFLVASYFVVVRYLSYLDLRIRLEGWEIELTMKAEGQRLARGLT